MLSLETIQQEAESAIQAATDLKALEALKVHYLGKKGALTDYLKTLGQLSAEERPAAGQKINAVKVHLQGLMQTKETLLADADIAEQLAAEAVDITLDGRRQTVGTVHPIVHTFNKLRDIFTPMGFVFMEGPEIEDDFHNFEALNIPEGHPARAMQDTFYFDASRLLRTHMSPVQIRAMKKLKPPLRMVAMGRVYRRDFDITHTPMFHQMECLVVDENVAFSDLKGLLKRFLHEFFGKEADIRLRPSYFPFTEPSAEVDMTCLGCEGRGCRICKNTGWLEILGCGMVHPNVLNAAGIDSTRYRGLAFGVGVDRLTMLKYQIADLRSLFENDLRFLKQF